MLASPCCKNIAPGKYKRECPKCGKAENHFVFPRNNGKYGCDLKYSGAGYVCQQDGLRQHLENILKDSQELIVRQETLADLACEVSEALKTYD
jgi:hypothetical protein